ncbi:MAG: SDR family oxidoreductase [Gelidibacter sp.]|nr:SDR family oxidoreductase [Gelidibacter sp.]
MELKFILVTGASSGIGKEIAVQLSKTNNVVLHGRDLDRLDEVKTLCGSKNQYIVWQQDLNKVDEIETSLTSFILYHKVVIDKIVHCAGYMKMAPLKISSLEVLSKTFNINVISASLLCKVLTQKKANNASLSNIVFISSNISNMGAKGMSAYGASKGAIDTLMRCLAVELAPKIRVNSVLPGAVLTEMTQNIFENVEVKNRMEATYPLGIGEPNDIFQMVNFLLSNHSKWITGQQFTVDGGRSINISG